MKLREGNVSIHVCLFMGGAVTIIHDALDLIVQPPAPRQ